MDTTSALSAGQDSARDSSRNPKESADCKGGCDIDIHIHSRGDVNIYNCTAPAPKEQPSPTPPGDDCPPPPTAEGACVPLGLGAKPKQSRQRKLEKLLANNRVPSTLAASFFHVSRRFLAGQSAANPFEESAFGVLRSLTPELRAVLSCSLRSFDSIPSNDRGRLFDASLPSDPNVPLDASTLAVAFSRELTERVGDLASVSIEPEQERPGQNRFFEDESEVPLTQLRICRVNGLRTLNFTPTLEPGDYLPAELEQHCEPILVDGEVQQNCEVLRGGLDGNCPGNFLFDDENTCLRVPEIQGGTGVILEGVNFISLDATVRLTPKGSGTGTREVEAHVFGDLTTPLNEVVDGETRTIRDCRVRDRLTFRVPDDLPSGVYSVQIAMPNETGIPTLGNPILSNEEFIRIAPPSTARFQIASEKLRARKETAPAFFGSDEVRVRVSAFPITATLTRLLLGAEQRFDSPEFTDVDSGDVREMKAVLFSHQQPIDGVVLTILGFEIDSEKAFEKQIDSFTDAFYEYLKEAITEIGKALTTAGIGPKDVLKFGLKHPIVLAIAAAVVLAVLIFVALWAPADLIIEDEIGLTVTDLDELTSFAFPSPGISEYTTPGDIEVKVTPLGKAPSEYREFREYRSDDEDSNYEVFLRYNRVA